MFTSMQAVELILVAMYQPPGGATDPPPTVIDPLDFPLWQWFVYGACAIIVTTAITLLICAVSFTCIYHILKLIPKKSLRG